MLPADIGRRAAGVGPWSIDEGGGPIVACALHAGHDLRREVADRIALDDRTRRYEEDPHTDVLTALAPTRVVVHRSRFEVDLNRPREAAVYAEPDDAWGLRVWRSPLAAGVRERSLALYDEFYRDLEGVLERAGDGGPFVVYDLHSYNHRRAGAERPTTEGLGDPDVNLGTGSMDRERWRGVVDRFLADLRATRVLGRALDIRENVRFRGGHLARFVHQRFPGRGCALAIETKKFFMDEHTGAVDDAALAEVADALAGTVDGVLGALAHQGR